MKIFSTSKILLLILKPFAETFYKCVLANTDWLKKAFPSLWTDYWLYTPVRKQRFLHPVPLTPALSLLSSYLCLCFSAFVLYPPETEPSHTGQQPAYAILGCCGSRVFCSWYTHRELVKPSGWSLIVMEASWSNELLSEKESWGFLGTCLVF